MNTCFEPITSVKLLWKNGWPYSQQFDDIYFSEQGIAESTHVFIQGNHLIERFAQLEHHDSFVIAELGLGTGLNLLLAIQYFKKLAPPTAQLHFFSIEKYPLSPTDLNHCLSLWPELSCEAELLRAAYPHLLTPGYHHCMLEERRIVLHLLLGDAESMLQDLIVSNTISLESSLRAWHVDAWFLDGFAPAKNPAMWSSRLFSSMALLSRQNTTLATFSAAGIVRRGLTDVGFHIKKQLGYGRKREMVVGSLTQVNPFRSTRYTPWHVSIPKKIQEKKAIVIGAGLAGCFTAYELARQGWQVTLLDEASAVAQRASANPSAVLYPNISVFRAPLTNFMLHAFGHATRCYKPWIKQGLIEGELNGVLQLATDKKSHQYFDSLKNWLHYYPDLGQLVTAGEASELADVLLSQAGLFIPLAGWLNAQKLCEFLIQASGVECEFNQSISNLVQVNGGWKVNDHYAPVVVLATGLNANRFLETEFLSLTPFKGQMTKIEKIAALGSLKIPVCAKGHLLPSSNKGHWIGATYHQGVTDQICDHQDDEENLKLIHSMIPSVKPFILDQWADVRVATRDYLPVVGPVPISASFEYDFSLLASNAKRFIPKAGAYHAGLYVCAGFGSRGLTTIPLSASYLAALISNSPFGFTRAMAQSLSPARFLIQNIVRNTV